MLLESNFRPPAWLRNAHAQTVAASSLRRLPEVRFQRERLELDDGDFLDIDWSVPAEFHAIVLVLHGLEGSSRSKYARGLVRSLNAAGVAAVVMNSRGCSGEPNRLSRRYHAGSTDDIACVVEMLGQRYPRLALFAVGYSLGGNALLKWLGETGAANPLTGAVAVSVPFDLAHCARRMEHGLSRFYQAHLLRNMKRAARNKREAIAETIEFPDLAGLDTFTRFDDALTAPLHGFVSASQYYRESSCKRFLPRIRIPTLILQALDDPFTYAHALPGDGDLSPQTTLEWSLHGGHVGFISADSDRRFWLEQRIPEWVQTTLLNCSGRSDCQMPVSGRALEDNQFPREGTSPE